MKNLFRKVFMPILQSFEQGQGEYNYSPSRRLILLAVGCLFVLLSMGLAASLVSSGEFVVLVPVLVFFAVGCLALIIGALGSDRAVAKIWGNK